MSSKPADPFVQACTLEILIHLAILILALLPIVLVVFPATIGLLLLTMLMNAVSGLFPSIQSYADQLSDWFWPCAGILAAITLTVSSFKYRRNIKEALAAESENSRCKELKGEKGTELLEIVQSLRKQLNVKARGQLSVVWFPSLSILAHARDAKGVQEIQVSAGLWDRVVHNDPLATVILGHEIGHLVNRDPILFRHLNALVVTAGAAMKVLGTFGLIAFSLILLQDIRGVIGAQFQLFVLVSHSLTIVTMAVLVLMIIPLSAIVVRRYVGFICSLIEVRADIFAAHWTNGRESLVRVLASDSSIHHSTFRDQAHSILSLQLTHISETERVDLLSSPQRLATPKLRYFLLSLVLPMLLPIGFFTPLLFGGAVNHFLVAGPVTALHFALVSMIIVAVPALPSGLSWRRLLALATGWSFASALPHLNLELLGYLLAHLGTSISQPGGLGVGTTTWASVRSDILLTFSDLNEKLIAAVYSGRIIGSIVLVFVCLWLLQLRASGLVASKLRRSVLGLLTASAGSYSALLLTLDPFRSGFFESWPLSLAQPLARATDHVQWFRPVLSILVSLVSFEILKFGAWLLLRSRTR